MGYNCIHVVFYMYGSFFTSATFDINYIYNDPFKECFTEKCNAPVYIGKTLDENNEYLVCKGSDFLDFLNKNINTLEKENVLSKPIMSFLTDLLKTNLKYYIVKKVSNVEE